MKANHKTFFLFLLFILHLFYSRAQQIYFNKVLPPAGKTFEHVTCILQDGQGFMWFATKRGLFRYDGFQMISYKNNPLDINSLASDALETISMDAKGFLWIGTAGAGLDRYDPASGTFTHFRHNDNDASSINSDWISTVLVDKEDVLWVGTGVGLDRYDSKTGTFKHYRYMPNDSTSISSNDIVSLYEDRQGTLWIGTGSVYGENKGKKEVGGLNRFNKKKGTFTRYMHDPENSHSLVSNKVGAIYEDSKGTLWVGTAGDGLHVMDRAHGTFQRYPFDADHPEKLSRPAINKVFSDYDHITFIKEDATGAMWIGTTESGLNYYDPKTKRVTHYESFKDSTGSFSDRTAWTAYISRDGVVWISSLSGNLYRINPQQWNIPFYQTGYKGINGFYEEEDGTFWIGSENAGLIQIDPVKGSERQFLYDPKNPGTLVSNSVGKIFKDRKGNLWIGTDSGLELFDKNSNTFSHYRHNPTNNKSISNNSISAFYEDRNENLWIGTLRGLNRMDRTTGLFKRYIFYPEDTSFFGSNTITSVLEDQKGQLWISSALGGGVHRLNPITGIAKTYLKGNSITGVFFDAAGTLWAGGNNLYRFNYIADTFYHYVDPVSPVEMTNIRSFIEDDKGNLWIAKPDGFLKINQSRNQSTLYSSNFGVDGNGLIYGSCYKTRNGKLFFGHSDGYYVFFPDQLTKGIKAPQIVISDFRLANRLVKPDKNGPLPEPLPELKKIQLTYDQNVFSFDFATIDFTNPEDNRHLFMLEHYDNDWRQSGADHRAYYFNVPPGSYTFRVKGANGYGIWAEKSIDIVILPPWWRTWWAYVLFTIIFVALIWGFIYYRSRTLRRENRILEEKVAHRTTQLQQSLENLKTTQSQLVQSEKMASLGELTAGIAHEIQNPLNFVNNFSEVNKELLAELNKEIEKGNYEDAKEIAKNVIDNQEKINHHGKRADAIVKGMMQHSRTNTGQKELTDINALADEYLRLSYHGLRAKDKAFNATLQTDFDKSIGKINIIPQDIGRVLLNLYNNAFYAVAEKMKLQPEDYEPTVSVSTKKLNDKVEIRVKDNGNGISQNIIDKIFQPFFTTKPTGQGTGLGLSLSYDIVKAHGGEIKVETKEKGGTVFIIQLPIKINE